MKANGTLGSGMYVYTFTDCNESRSLEVQTFFRSQSHQGQELSV